MKKLQSLIQSIKSWFLAPSLSGWETYIISGIAIGIFATVLFWLGSLMGQNKVLREQLSEKASTATVTTSEPAPAASTTSSSSSTEVEPSLADKAKAWLEKNNVKIIVEEK